MHRRQSKEAEMLSRLHFPLSRVTGRGLSRANVIVEHPSSTMQENGDRPFWTKPRVCFSHLLGRLAQVAS